VLDPEVWAGDVSAHLGVTVETNLMRSNKNSCIFHRVPTLIMFDRLSIGIQSRKNGFCTLGGEHAMSVFSSDSGRPENRVLVEERAGCDSGKTGVQI
jgi:hypothetical protein